MKKSLKFLRFVLFPVILNSLWWSCSTSEQKTDTPAAGNLPAARYVTVYLVAYGDKVKAGSEPPNSIKFGCDDYLVPTQLALQAEEKDDLRTALQKLFTVREHTLGGIALVNTWTMYGTRVQIDAIYDRGYTTFVEISGNIRSGGVCADPRIMSQLEETIRHYKRDFVIKYNGSESNWQNLFYTGG